MAPPSLTAEVFRSVLIALQPLAEAQTAAMGEPTVWATIADAKLTFLYTLVLRDLLPQFLHTVYAVPGFGALSTCLCWYNHWSKGGLSCPPSSLRRPELEL